MIRRNSGDGIRVGTGGDGTLFYHNTCDNNGTGGSVLLAFFIHWLHNSANSQFVGYGSMLTEGFLAVIVILACVAGLGFVRRLVIGFSRSTPGRAGDGRRFGPAGADGHEGPGGPHPTGRIKGGKGYRCRRYHVHPSTKVKTRVKSSAAVPVAPS